MMPIYTFTVEREDIPDLRAIKEALLDQGFVSLDDRVSDVYLQFFKGFDIDVPSPPQEDDVETLFHRGKGALCRLELEMAPRGSDAEFVIAGYLLFSDPKTKAETIDTVRAVPGDGGS